MARVSSFASHPFRRSSYAAQSCSPCFLSSASDSSPCVFCLPLSRSVSLSSYRSKAQPLILAELHKQSSELQEIKAALSEKKRLAVVLSEIDSDAFKLMLSKGGFRLDATSDWPDELTQRLIANQSLAPPPPFQWSDENEPNQKDRYVPYLRNHLQAGLSRAADLVDLDSKKSFLNVFSDHRLLFDITGTTDVAVVHRGYITARADEQGILAVIELKKECTPKATRQTIGQLIAADILSTFSPLAVLSDLRDEWHFYWLEGRTIKHLCPPSGPNVRQLAFLFLRLALAPSFVVGEQLAAANTFVDALPVSVGKRRKLSPVKENRAGHDDEDEKDHLPSDGDSDLDEADRLQLKCQQVRRWVRNTPWLREICRSPLRSSMSKEANNMFG